MTSSPEGLSIIYKDVTLPVAVSPNLYKYNARTVANWSDIGTIHIRPLSAFYITNVGPDTLRISTPIVKDEQATGDAEGYIDIISVGF